MFQRFISIFLSMAMLCILSSGVLAADESTDRQITPIPDQGAELFGLAINDLNKADFETRLSKMGLQPYPSYKKEVATYSLGAGQTHEYYLTSPITLNRYLSSQPQALRLFLIPSFKLVSCFNKFKAICRVVARFSAA